MAEATAPAQTTVTADPNAGAWHATLDADTKGWVGGMGLDKLDAPAALAKVLPMYRGAEQKLGLPADQVLRIPGKDAKPEDWRAVWSRLGAPEKPEGYELKAPEGDPGEFLKTASGWFHELGVPKGMAAGLAGKWNDYVQATMVAEDGKWNQRFEGEINDLKGEWKTDYDKNTDLAKRVMRAGGWTQEQLTSMERALGPKAFLSGFAKFGGMVGEHRFVGGDGAKGFQMSAEGAKARITALQADPAWQSKYLSGDADAKAEFTRLQQIANPEQALA